MPTPVIVSDSCLLFPVLGFHGDSQPFQCFLPVQILAAFIGRNADLPGRQINGTNTGFYFVDILPALSTAAKGFKQNLSEIEGFRFSSSTAAEIQKPILALVSGAIGALADPLHGTDELR